MQNRRWFLTVVLGTVAAVLVFCGGGGFLLYQLNFGIGHITHHPWWDRPISEADADRLLTLIQNTPGPIVIRISSNGAANVELDASDRFRAPGAARWLRVSRNNGGQISRFRASVFLVQQLDKAEDSRRSP